MDLVINLPWKNTRDAPFVFGDNLWIKWRIHGAGIYANIKGYIHGIHVTIYSSTMDPMGMKTMKLMIVHHWMHKFRIVHQFWQQAAACWHWERLGVWRCLKDMDATRISTKWHLSYCWCSRSKLTISATTRKVDIGCACAAFCASMAFQFQPWMINKTSHTPCYRVFPLGFDLLHVAIQDSKTFKNHHLQLLSATQLPLSPPFARPSSLAQHLLKKFSAGEPSPKSTARLTSRWLWRQSRRRR